MPSGEANGGSVVTPPNGASSVTPPSGVAPVTLPSGEVPVTAGEVGSSQPDDPPSAIGVPSTDPRCGQSPESFTMVTTQDQVDALAGCVEISGALVIDPPAGVRLDLRPLSSIRRVWQDLMLGCNPLTASSSFCDESGASLLTLEGLENLEAVGTLTLGGLSVTSLAPLRKLSYLGGFLDITQCDELTSLEGLEGLPVQYFSATHNAKLASLRGLKISPANSSITLANLPALTDLSALAPLVSSFAIRLEQLPIQNLDALQGLTDLRELYLTDLPELSDIRSLEQLSELDYLSIVRTGLEDLDDLQIERVVGRLLIVENPRLTQVDALGSLSLSSELDVSGNATLQRLPAFPGISTIESLNVSENPALVEGPSFPNLLDMFTGSINITANPSLQRVEGFSGLQHAGAINIHRNAQLQSVAFPELLTAFDLIITCNFALPDASLQPLREVATVNDRELEGNQGAEAQCAVF